MRVLVTSFGEGLDTQVRTYAEYRFFSALAPHDIVRGARVRLCVDGRQVQCSVRIALHRGSMTASASGTHATAAIDKAADRVAALMDSRRHAIR